MQNVTIQGNTHSISSILLSRKETYFTRLSGFVQARVLAFYDASITASQLQSAIEAKLRLIPRFGKYFVSGLDKLSLLPVEQLIQEDWNQYRKTLEGHRWEKVLLQKSFVHEKKRYYLGNILQNLKIVDFKQLPEGAQQELFALSRISITTEQMRSGLEQSLMLFDSRKDYFILGLGNFSVLPTEQLTIVGKTYPIAQLFQEISKDKISTFFGLSRAAANQWSKLIDGGIYVDKVRDMLLAEYWKQLRSMLNKNFTCLPNLANNLSIRNKNINGFDTLFSNRSLTFDDLEDSEKKLLRDAILNQENSPSVIEIKQELRRLRGDDICPTTTKVPTKQPSKTPVKNSEQPDGTSSTQEKNGSEQTTASTKNSKQKTKVSKSKTLTITLASVGGTALLAGVSGFLYWFVKLRK